jgi:hypothetical protein
MATQLYLSDIAWLTSTKDEAIVIHDKTEYATINSPISKTHYGYTETEASDKFLISSIASTTFATLFVLAGICVFVASIVLKRLRA